MLPETGRKITEILLNEASSLRTMKEFDIVHFVHVYYILNWKENKKKKEYYCFVFYLIFQNTKNIQMYFVKHISRQLYICFQI